MQTAKMEISGEIGRFVQAVRKDLQEQMKRHKRLVIIGGIFLLVSQVLLAVFTAPPSAETVLRTEPDIRARVDGAAFSSDTVLPPVEYIEVAEEHPFYGMAGVPASRGSGLIFEGLTWEQSAQLMDAVLAGTEAETEPETETEAETEPPSLYENRVVITAAAYLNIRAENDSDSQVIGKIYHGTSADLLEQGEQFSKITSGAITGWVSNEYILTGAAAEEYAQQQGSVTIATVTAGWLNVREKPDTASDVVATVEAGQWFIVTDRGGGWVKIDYTSNIEGYLNEEYISVSESFGQAFSVAEEQNLMKLAEEKEAMRESQKAEENKISETEKTATTAKGTETAKTSETINAAAGTRAAETAKAAETARTTEGTKTSEGTKAAETTKASETTKVPETAKTPETASAPETQTPSGVDSTGYDDLYLLAAIIQLEAGHDYDGCLAVANVILNRVNSGSYPNSIHGVIYQSGQFPGTGAGGTMEKILLAGPGSTPKRAAADAMAGSNNIGDYTQFTPDSHASSIEYPYSDYKVVGGNCFYRK